MKNLSLNKIKSYVLLMMYDVDNIVKSSSSYILANKKDLDLKELGTFIKYYSFDETESLNIADWNNDWDKCVELLVDLERIICRIPKVFQDQVILSLIYTEVIDLKKEPNENVKDVETLVKRITFLINKYINLIFFYKVIHSNYLDFNKHNEGIEIGTPQFDYIVLKEYNHGGRFLDTKRWVREMRIFISNSIRESIPTFQQIKNFPPFEFLGKIKTSKGIDMYFKKEFAKDLLPYLNAVNSQISKKEHFLGSCFAFMQLSFNEEEFINKMAKKIKFYREEHSWKEYTKYLRTEGHNIFKSL
jgi:hypothetical protein